MSELVLLSVFRFLFVVELLKDNDDGEEEIDGLDMWYTDGGEEEEEESQKGGFLQSFALLSPPNCRLLLLFRSLSKVWREDVANWIRSAILVAAKGVVPAPIKDYGWLASSIQSQNFRESGNTICFCDSECGSGGKGLQMSIFAPEDEEEDNHSPPGDGQIAWDLTRSVFACHDFELNGDEYDFCRGIDGMSFEERKAFYQGRVFQRIADNATVSFCTPPGTERGEGNVGPAVERDRHEFTSMREEMCGPAMREVIYETITVFGPLRNEKSRYK